MKIVAIKKQKNADSDGEDDFPFVDAIVAILRTGVMIPPIACPWNRDPIYVAGNNPANAAKDP